MWCSHDASHCEWSLGTVVPPRLLGEFVGLVAIVGVHVGMGQVPARCRVVLTNGGSAQAETDLGSRSYSCTNVLRVGPKQPQVSVGRGPVLDGEVLQDVHLDVREFVGANRLVERFTSLADTTAPIGIRNKEQIGLLEM